MCVHTIKIISLYLPSSRTENQEKTLDTAISIDIGGTNTKIALVDSNGAILARERLQTRASQSVESYFESIFQQIDHVRRPFPQVKLVGIGIGAPACNERDGTIERSANLLFKERVPIRQIFADRYRLPAHLIKDANAAALGEQLFGGGRGMDNFILLTLGTGLGGGIILNGRLVSGSSGLASEMGHMRVPGSAGRRCGCGRRGCLETYVSATGIIRTVFALLAEETAESRLRHISYAELTAHHIFEAAHDGDPIACLAFERTGAVLGAKMADLVAALEPEAIFLSGGLAQAGDLLLQPAQEHLDRDLLHLMQGKVSILPSQLGADDAALLGAASLPLFNQKEKIL